MADDFSATGLIGDTPGYSEVNAVWPDLGNDRAAIAPVRNGVDRRSFKLLQGWDHVEQSLLSIFATPYHRRILRRWVGSFVPRLLGESAVARIITRYVWAVATDVDLWEPNYRIKQVFFMGAAVGEEAASISFADELRLGHAYFRHIGIYRPAGHLGDFTPSERRGYDLIGHGSAIWDIAPL